MDLYRLCILVGACLINDGAFFAEMNKIKEERKGKKKKKKVYILQSQTPSPIPNPRL